MNINELPKLIFMIEFKNHKNRAIDWEWDKVAINSIEFTEIAKKKKTFSDEYKKFFESNIDVYNGFTMTYKDRRYIIDMCSIYAQHNNLFNIEFEEFYTNVIEFIKLRQVMDSV